MSELRNLNVFEEVVFDSFSNFLSGLVTIVDTYYQTESKI